MMTVMSYTDEKYVSQEFTFSTVQIEESIFYGESSSPGQPLTNIAEEAGNYRLIGDELMRVEEQRLPIGAVRIGMDSALRKLSKQESE